MTVLEVPQTLPERIEYLLHPVVELERPTRRYLKPTPWPWQNCFEQLAAWARDPEQLSDEDIEAPSGRMLRLAMDVRPCCVIRNAKAPNHVVPTATAALFSAGDPANAPGAWNWMPTGRWRRR